MPGAITNASNDAQSIRNQMASLKTDVEAKSASIRTDGFPHLAETLDAVAVSLAQTIDDLSEAIDTLGDAASVSGL